MISRVHECAEEFTALWNEGVSSEEIADALNIATTTVHAWRVRLGLSVRPRLDIPETRSLELIREAWVSGKSASQIAKLLNDGRSRNSIIGIAYRNGWKRNGASAPAKAPREPGPVRARPRPVRTKLPVPFAGTIQPTGAEAEAIIAKRIADGQAALVRAGKVTVESPNARPFLDAPRIGVCKWPIGEGVTMLSCCNPVERGGLCAGHAAIGFQPKQNESKARTERTVSHLTRFDRVDQGPRVANDGGGVWDAVA